ncbi:MAG TPA: pentapeptide repeat-containing protein [Streptosporangiaceae bacterium]|nr:pentapeptide repeat-containing protein [Streptosporangiaceae bacterium]
MTVDGGRGRRAWLATSIVIGGLIAPIAVAAAATVGPALACQPGSGPHLADRTLTQAQIGSYAPGSLHCADLAGANLSGLSLIQIDLTGANLRNADLQHADLTQATLSGADLSGANLSHATMIQVTGRGARFAGANLSNVDLGQADLTGADLNGANLSGTSFVQADLGQATFRNATGVTPWSEYLLIASLVVFVLLALGSLRRRGRPYGGMAARGRMAGMGGPSAAMGGPSAAMGMNAIGSFNDMPGPGMPGMMGGMGINAGRAFAGSRFWLLRGLLGAVVIAFGFHLFIGGLLDEFVGGFGAPLQQTCSGPLCAVGVASGFIGLFGGILLIIVGFGVRASGRR